MHIIKNWAVRLLLPLFLLPAPVFALELNGTAVYSQLNRDYYLAGLYLPSSSNDPRTIFSAATDKRMQLIVRAQNWSPRSWNEHWQNNIAINNDDSEADEQLQQALWSFMHFPRNDLIYNDEVIIDYQAHGNSRVLLNGELVLEVPGTDFINHILKTWIGKLPPSRDFRQQILNANSITPARRDLLVRHLRERTNLWSTWLATEQAELQRQQQEQEQIAEQQRLALAQAAALEQQRLALEKTKALEQQRLAAEQQAIVEREQIADTELLREAKKIANEKTLILKNNQQLIIDQRAKQLATTENANSDLNEKTIIQQQRYYLDMLQWQLQRQVQALVEYPLWAKQFKQQGLVEIDFILKRNLETEQLQVRNPQSPSLLVDELKRVIPIAIKKTSIPNVLAGDYWPIGVYYQFSLEQKEQPRASMPKAPSSLINEARKQNKLELLDHYKTHIAERIRNAVQYPLGAKTLKKQDSVSVQLVLVADGSIKRITDIHKSKHTEFNQALHEAIKLSEPFPPFPLALTEKEISIDIDYEFKL